MNKQLTVIGGGAAGMMAAICAARRGTAVTLLEPNERLGKKLNITGKGRCNVTNDAGCEELLANVPQNGRFLYSAFSRFDGRGTMAFFEELGVPLKVERGRRVFPVSDRAFDVSAALERELRRLRVTLVRDRAVCVLTDETGAVRGVKGEKGTYPAQAVVLATGCRERTRGAIAIPGTRPAGVYTAGAAQNLLNTKNLMVGRRVVILGSGDIGLIMARRLTLEGATVLCVAEARPVPGGLERNVSQCLYDFGIPLYLSTTVTQIFGPKRVEGVELCQVDAQGQPMPETARRVDCDTLLLSVGLIPENEVGSKAGMAVDPATNGAVTDDFLQDRKTTVPVESAFDFFSSTAVPGC